MCYHLKPLNGGPIISLSQEVLIVGRSPRCDVVLDQTQFVSRRHCRIVTVGGRVILNDLGSTNGVYVNRTKIGPFFVLQSGDRVRIGGLKFEVMLGSHMPHTPDVTSSGTASDDWSINLVGKSTGVSADSPQPVPHSHDGDHSDQSRSISRAADKRRSVSTSEEGRRKPHRGPKGSRSARGLPGDTVRESPGGSPVASESKRSSKEARGRNRVGSPASQQSTRSRKRRQEDDIELVPVSAEQIPLAAMPNDEKASVAAGIQQRGAMPPPSSMFIKTDWAEFEQAGTAVQQVVLECPSCTYEFEWTVERLQDGQLRLTTGICAKCGRDISPLSEEEIEQLLQLEELAPDEDEGGGMTYAAAGAQGLYNVRRHGGVEWARVLQSLEIVFLASLATGFLASTFFSIVTMGVFGNLLAQIGSVFIPFAQERPSPEGAELVWKGVATCGVGGLPLILLISIYNITDESFLFALGAVIAGVVFSLVIWMGGAVSIIPFYILTILGLIAAIAAVAVGTCFAWRVPSAAALQKYSISATVCLLAAASGAVVLLCFSGAAQDHVLGRVPTLPASWMLLATYGALAAGVAAYGWLLQGMALHFRDPQLYESVKGYLLYHGAAAFFCCFVLLASPGLDGDSPEFAGLGLVAGLVNAIDLLWFANVVGSSRYLIR